MKRIIAIILTLLFFTFLTSCACEHEFSNATCTKPATCTKCGETQGTALGHSFREATCTSPKICSRCGETQGVALGHTVTCADSEPCARCGTKLEHHFKGNVKTGIIYCTGCSEHVNEMTINSKSFSELTVAEKAYIQWVINDYMTAVNSSGKYIYTTTEAYSNAAKILGYSSAEIKVFWENHAGMSAYNTIYSKK